MNTDTPADIWYHGSPKRLEVGDYLLSPHGTGLHHWTSNPQNAGYVYVTSWVELAKLFVGRDGGFVYRVRPSGQLYPDPSPSWGTLGCEYRCRCARVLECTEVSADDVAAALDRVVHRYLLWLMDEADMLMQTALDLGKPDIARMLVVEAEKMRQAMEG